MKAHTPAKKPSRGASVRKVSPMGANRRSVHLGLTARIRAHLVAIDGPFSAAIVARELKIPAARLYHYMLPMRRRGEVKKLGRGWYEYKKVPLYRQSPVLWPRIFRAIHVKRRFSIREIALLTDTYPRLARYLVNKLQRAGEIEVIGTQRTPRKQWEQVYRVKNRDEFFLKHVKGV